MLPCEEAAIGPGRLADNLVAVHAWNLRREFARVGGEPEREEWGMRPYTVNAYYNPLNNEIVLPAAILSAPGYAGETLDDAVLYGYVATTIGHELTHGFDDSGRHYGATGRLEEGWSPATEAAFRARCEKLIASYDREEPLPGMRVNGRLTLSENIADLGGVELALDAFLRTETCRSGRKIDGQTPLQRFFLAYAFSFAGQVRPETLAKQLRSDTHAPAAQHAACGCIKHHTRQEESALRLNSRLNSTVSSLDIPRPRPSPPPEQAPQPAVSAGKAGA